MQTHLLKIIYDEMGSVQKLLLLQTEVPWLAQGKALEWIASSSCFFHGALFYLKEQLKDLGIIEVFKKCWSVLYNVIWLFTCIRIYYVNM